MVTGGEWREIGQNDGTGVLFRFWTQTRWRQGDCVRCFCSQEKTDAFEFCFELDGFSLNGRTLRIRCRMFESRTNWRSTATFFNRCIPFIAAIIGRCRFRKIFDDGGDRDGRYRFDRYPWGTRRRFFLFGMILCILRELFTAVCV